MNSPVIEGKVLIDTGPSSRGWHRLESAMRCLQLYSYIYNLGIHEETEPLIRGTLGHVGLAHYYARLRARQQGTNPDMYHDPLDAIALKARMMGTAGEVHAEKVQAAVRDYMQQYAMETLTIHGIEEEVGMYFNGHWLTQRWDLDVVDKQGLHWIFDHKFVSAVQGKTVMRYALSGQFLNMAYQARNKYGDAFGGIRINIVGVDTRKFVRASPPPAPMALRHFPQTVADAESLIASCVGRDPWSYPRASSELVCMTPYGPCPGFELCSWGPGSVPG